ncbi:MAG TPA: BlaI/MecI/CopY family transcriptional regulator [Verrucomicrobiae bacterium]|jgi:predicted transcriptional regulator
MTNDQQLSRRERQIMDVLHSRGHATGAEIHQALPDAPSYSAVRALLRILEQKGHAKHREDGPRYVYLATEPRARARRSALRRVLSTFYGGSVEQAVAGLLEAADTRLTEDELKQIQTLINNAKEEGR